VISLLPLGLTGAGSAQAAGLTTVFDPANWVLVNTNPSGTTGGIGTGTGPTNISCNPPTKVDTCVNPSLDNGFSLFGYPGTAANVFQTRPNTTTLTLPSNNWRPYIITFNWAFDPKSVSTKIGMSISYGTIFTNGYEGNNFSASADNHTIFTSEPATVYLPPGASLTFSIYSTSPSAAPFFTMKGFDAVEVPAPLPISGSSAVLLYSRRLRRRTLTASSQPPALHPTTGKVLSLAEQRSRHQHQRALSHYGTLLGGPLVSVLPTPSVSSQIANTISSRIPQGWPRRSPRPWRRRAM
jgi:hypothetical protein